jgi:D-glycero-beta-D-manno-heptose-7-phosphate kinase
VSLDFSNTSILVIGDFMLDSFVMGSSNRISPEAPVPVVLEKEKSMVLGGAGNVVNNLSSLGCSKSQRHLFSCGVLGDDNAGKTILKKLSEISSISGMIIDPNHISTIKERIFIDEEQVLRLDKEIKIDTNKYTEAIEKYCSSVIQNTDIIIISDYNKGIVTNKMVKLLINQARDNSIKVIIDPKKLDFSNYKNANIITPNLGELERAAKIKIKDDGQLESVCKALIKEHNFEFILATKSEKGMSLIGKDSVCHIDPIHVENPDVSGAGDTVVATLASCLALGFDVNESAKIANIAASIVVAKPGTATIFLNELNLALR